MPVVKQDGQLWFVEIPALGGRVQRFRCQAEAHAKRFLAVFVRAEARRARSPRAGWPFTR